MKNKYFVLCRTLIPEGFSSLMASAGTSKKKKKRKSAFTSKPWLGLLISYIILILYSSLVGVGTSKNLVKVGLEDQLLSSVAFMIPIFTLIFGFLQAITSLYHESKIDLLLVMPLKPSTIVAAKLTEVYVYVYLTIAVFFLPALIANGVIAQRSWGFYLLLIPFTVLSSIAPFAIFMILIFLLMRFTRFARNKDRFQTVSSIILVVLILIFSINIGRYSGADEAYSVNLIPSDVSNTGLRFLPVSLFSTKMLQQADSIICLKYLIYALAITVICVALMLFTGNKLYLNGVLGSKGAKKVKELSNAEMNKALKSNSALSTLIKADWKVMLRTPAFFMQTVVSSLLVPVILLVSSLIGFTSGSDATNGPAFIDIARYYFTTDLWWSKHLWIVVMVISAISIFFSSSNVMSSTAITRKGEAFQISKMIPVSPLTQLTSWFLPGFLFSSCIWLIIVITVSAYFRFSWTLILLCIVLGLLNTYSMHMAGISLDMKFPNLTWTSETAAMKRSKASTIDVFGSIALAGLIIGLGFLVKKITDGNSAIISVVLLLVSLVLPIVFTLLARKLAKNIFKRIEI